MKKKGQFFSAASITAVLAAAAVLPAAGAQKGWQQEGDKWVYLNSDGTKETSSWVKGGNGERFYVDEDGYMAVNTIIKDGDNIYYVDEDGARVRNQWVSEPNINSLCDQDVSVLWYYFGDDGKAVAGDNKSLKLNVNGEDRTYFFDGEGHMLSGWQKIPKKDGGYDTYYLGNENQGYVHSMWQYLEPNEEILDNSEDNQYDGTEMFYFGWANPSSTGENQIDGKWYLFDDNGVMLRGWQPGVIITGGHVGFNKYYDEVTGERASGWLYAYGVGGRENEPFWFYLSEKNGTAYNEGGKDSDDRLAYKVIDGATYFFDEQGHMITGLISTEGKPLGSSECIEEKYTNLKGDIGKGTHKKPAGIYYLGMDDSNLGHLQTNKRINVGTKNEPCYYFFDGSGRAYENALVSGRIYGQDGSMLCSDDGWSILTVEEDIYQAKDYSRGKLKEPDTAKPIIEAGTEVAIGESGIVKKDGTVKIGGTVYKIKNYVAEPED